MKYLSLIAAVIIAVFHSFCAQAQLNRSTAIFRNENIFWKITTNPASNHHEGGLSDPQDGSVRLYLKNEYAGKIKAITYYVFRQTAHPELNPHVTIPVSGSVLTIPELRYASYALMELQMQDGRMISMDTTQPLYIFSAGLYAQPSGNLADYTAGMEGSNKSGFIVSFNQNAAMRNSIQARGINPTPLGCNDGIWTVIWTISGSTGGPIIVAENSCGDRFAFECIQHNGPGVVAGDVLNSNGGDPCNGTLVLTPNFPSQTYRALPITPVIDVGSGCIPRNAATGANGSLTVTGSWMYLPTNNWSTGTISASRLPATYSWSDGGTGITKNYSIPGTYTLSVKIGSCTFSKAFTIGRNGYAGRDTTKAFCSNVGIISLSSLAPNADTGGTWTRTGGSGGVFNATAKTFNPSGAANSVFKYTAPATGSGCNSDAAYVTINIANPVKAGKDSTIAVCINATAAINLASLNTGAQSGGTWTRTGGTGGTFNAAAGTFIPANATASTFSYIVTGGASPCPATDTSKVTVNINPAATAGTSGNTTVCSNNTASINLYDLIGGETAGGAWTSVAGTGGTFNAAAGTFQPAGNGAAAAHTFLYTVSNTCNTDTSLAMVSIIPCCSLSVAATATTISCASATATVSAAVTNGSGSYTYSWTGPNGFAAGSASFTTTVTGNYTVTVTDVSNATCTAQATIAVVSAINNPAVTLTGSNPVCTNSPVTITTTVQNGTGAAPFTYEFSNSSGTILQTGSSNTLTIVPSGISSIGVKVTGSNGCSAIQNIVVNNPGPALTLTNIVSICAGQSTTVKADNGGIAGYIYLWTDNSTTNPVRDVAPPATTSYTVVRTTAQGCIDTATATIQVFAKPAITNVAAAQPNCSGTTGSITVSATGDIAQLRYRLNSGVWQASNVFNNLAAGTYTVSVGNTNGTCNDTTTPPIMLTLTSTISSGIAGPAGVCALEDGLFQANPGVSGAVYSWSATGSPAITGGNTASIFIAKWAANQAGATQTVTLTVTLGSCSQTYNKAVVINNAIFAIAGNDKAICPQAQVSVGLPPAQAGPPGATFSWTPTQYILGSSSASSVLVNPPVTTNFILTVTDPINGCTRKDTVTVIVDVAVNPVADAGTDKTLPVASVPDTVRLGGPNTTQPGVEPNTTIGYLWTALNGSPISALSATNIANPVFTRPGTAAKTSTYTYMLMVQKQYIGPSSLQGVTCPVFDTVNVSFTSLPVTVRLSPKVLLQGALYGNSPTAYVSDSVMRDNLRSQNIIPFSTPYPTLTDPITGSRMFIPVSNAVPEEIGLTPNGQYPPALILGLTGNNAIVDWVFLELRSASNPQKTVATRSALMQRDGDIVDMDGFSPVAFSNITDLNCYLVVRHRNHLGVMTKNPLILTENTQLVDFSHTPAAGGVETYGNYAQKSLTNNHLALWAGNINTDRFIIFSGTNNDPNILQYIVFNAPNNTTQSISYIYPAYTTGDVDMRGTAIAQGTGNDANYISENIFSHPANANRAQTYIIFEQVPPRNN